MPRDSFVDFVVDQLRLLGSITTKPLAGGYRLFRDGIPFGYVKNRRVYFATTELTRRSFIEHDMGAYRETDSPQLSNYYEVPPDVLDDQEALVGWARVALAPSAPDDDTRDEEMVDIINDNDEVVGRSTINEAYREHTPHRIVHVLIFNPAGDMALQLRSKTKSFCPNHWSTTAAGHVDSGETYLEAARRETIEEVGIDVSLTEIGKHWYINGFDKKSLTIFRGTFEGPFHVNPAEVQRVEFFSPAQIANMIANQEPMHPELLFLLQRLGSLYETNLLTTNSLRTSQGG